jgi:hypothetical protein
MLLEDKCYKAHQNSDTLIPDYTASHPHNVQSTISYGLPSVQKSNCKYTAATVGHILIFLPQMAFIFVAFLFLMTVTKALPTKLQIIASWSNKSLTFMCFCDLRINETGNVRKT